MFRARQAERNRDGERQGRRRKLQDRLAAQEEKLPDAVKETLRRQALTREVGMADSTVKGQLIQAIFDNALYHPHEGWTFSRSVRDLSLGGLLDGKAHHRAYLNQCMADLVKQGVLKKLVQGRGRPSLYQVEVPPPQNNRA